MDRIEQTLVTQRKQIADLGEAMAAQSAINKAIRAELEGFGITLITHGDALEEAVSRIEEMQARIEDVLIPKPAEMSNWIDGQGNPIPIGVVELTDESTPKAPPAKSEAQIEAEKLEKAKAKADKALGVRP